MRRSALLTAAYYEAGIRGVGRSKHEFGNQRFNWKIECCDLRFESARNSDIALITSNLNSGNGSVHSEVEGTADAAPQNRYDASVREESTEYIQLGLKIRYGCRGFETNCDYAYLNMQENERKLGAKMSSTDHLKGLLWKAAAVAFIVAFASLQSGLAMELRPAIAKQGQTIEVLIPHAAGGTASGASTRSDASTDSGGGTASGADAASSAQGPTVTFNKKDYKTFVHQKDGELYSRALVGVPADLPLGTYTIKSGDTSEKLKVVAGGFGVQAIRLPPGKDNFVASPGEEAAVDGAKGTVSNMQYWDGKFIRPVQSRISSTFGLRRRVNGKLLTDYFHSGLDFAAATGTPVKAVQKGKVILARRGWKLHGNTICIDHGQGVISFYIHLSKVLVKEGDIVDAGQKIGAVGSTGRANGPHLHFSIYVNKDATNPGDWFTKGF